MFEIEYKGGTGAIIATKKSTLVIDPKVSLHGAKDTVTKNAIVMATEPRFLTDVQDAILVIDGPGEYEVGDFSIRGVAVQRHLDTPDAPKAGTAYRVEAGDMRIAVLGNIEAALSDEQLEFLGVVDILLLPVGGNGYTLDPHAAAGVVRRIDPKAIIPMNYADSGLRYEVAAAELSEFIKEIAVPVETVSKLKFKSAAQLPATLTVFEVTRS